MKLSKKCFYVLTGFSFIMVGINAYAAAGIVCPAVSEINYKCNSSHRCEFHATSGGVPNDFSGLPEALNPLCVSDFDCSIIASKSPIASVGIPNTSASDVATCYYTIQNNNQFLALLYSSHYPHYDYTPADAPECKGATASDKSGYCVTYNNTAIANNNK
jgi:hypothetical protein